MGALVLMNSCILALLTGAAVAQGLSTTPTWVRPIEVYACPSDSGTQATWLISQATLGQAQPSAFRRVGLGPLIDMDNRRRDDEDRARRRQEKLRQEAQQDEELRQHYRNYGYTSPPFIYPDPRLGYRGYYGYPGMGYYPYAQGGRGYSPFGGGYYCPYGHTTPSVTIPSDTTDTLHTWGGSLPPPGFAGAGNEQECRPSDGGPSRIGNILRPNASFAYDAHAPGHGIVGLCGQGVWLGKSTHVFRRAPAGPTAWNRDAGPL